MVPEGTTLIASDMAKHIHTSTLELFEKNFGPTKTSLAKKKARLIFSTVDKNLPEGKQAFPKTLEHNQMQLVNHAGVFSRQKLDIGTRFFSGTSARSTAERQESSIWVVAMERWVFI